MAAANLITGHSHTRAHARDRLEEAPAGPKVATEIRLRSGATIRQPAAPALVPLPGGLPPLDLRQIRDDLERWGQVVGDKLLDTLLSVSGGQASSVAAWFHAPQSTAPGALSRVERAVDVAERQARRAWMVHEAVKARPLFERSVLILFYRDFRAARGADAQVGEHCGIAARQVQLYRLAGERAVMAHVNGLRRGRA